MLAFSSYNGQYSVQLFDIVNFSSGIVYNIISDKGTFVNYLSLKNKHQ